MGGEEYEESYVFTSVVFMYEKNHWQLIYFLSYIHTEGRDLMQRMQIASERLATSCASIVYDL